MDSKINGLDDRVDRMVAASEQAEKRIAKLESQLAELVSHGVPPGPPGLGGRRPGGEERRLRTLVYGGWARESRRKVILEELQEAVASLGVADLLDDSPFTTGARRSMALSSFNQRARGILRKHEKSHAGVHRILRAFAEANVKTPDGRRLWASYSKSPQERAHGAHASWVKTSCWPYGRDQALSTRCGVGVQAQFGLVNPWLRVPPSRFHQART